VALQKKDPYLLALAANTLWLLKKTEKALEVTRELVRTQAENGSFTGLSHSITYSTGQALTVETTGIALLALTRAENPDRNRIDKAVRFLCDQRKAQGGFGNSQATIVALKALTAYVVFAKVTPEDGSCTLLVNGKEAGQGSWKAGQRGVIKIEGWENLVQDGENRLDFRFEGMKEPLPFTLGLDYHTSLPPNDPGCSVDVKTRLSRNRVPLGQALPMEVELSNKTPQGLPMTMACVAIPAGCQVAPAELRRLMETKTVDFYETRGNRLFFYFRQMAPSETRKINVTLSPILKGSYQASASSAYLYYTAERKNWAPGLDLVVE
jgi:alpha-2-macroglobulin-like protein